MKKCPNCGCTRYATEKRPNGDHVCSDCQTSWWNSPNGACVITGNPRPLDKPAPKTSAELLAQQVEEVLERPEVVPGFMRQVERQWKRSVDVIREMCSEMMNLQLALAQAKTKIKVLEERIFAGPDSLAQVPNA